MPKIFQKIGVQKNGIHDIELHKNSKKQERRGYCKYTYLAHENSSIDLRVGVLRSLRVLYNVCVSSNQSMKFKLLVVIMYLPRCVSTRET